MCFQTDAAATVAKRPTTASAPLKIYVSCTHDLLQVKVSSLSLFQLSYQRALSLRCHLRLTFITSQLELSWMFRSFKLHLPPWN